LLLAGFSFFVVAGCDPIQVDKATIDKVESPAYDVDALLITTDAGATTSVGYHLVLVKRGESGENADLEDSIITADRLNNPGGIVVKWKGKDIDVMWPNSQIIRAKEHEVVGGQTFRIHFTFDKDQKDLQLKP